MWRLRFLGNLSAEKEGVATALAPRKYTALLAYLVLHPTRRFSRDALATLFWPDSDDDAGRAALRTALSTLRKDFGPDIFEANGVDRVRVRADQFTTDTEEFDRLLRQAGHTVTLPEQEAALLDEALALYNGPLLPGIYADWALEMRERLQTDYERLSRRRETLQKAALSEKARQTAEGKFRRKAEGPAFQRLPFYNNRYIGRAPELKRLTALLCGTGDEGTQIRLLTLTGPGGIGKTRLAAEVAQRVAAHFSGAVCFVPLAALTTGEEIGTALADTLQITAGEGSDAFGQALFRLNELGPSLLVLDNLEQLVETGAAKALRALLARLPQAVILTTSRRLLGIEGEQEFVVSPLPSDHCRLLFCDHARAARPDFAGKDTATLSALCDRLEGIPLAVELCAPWVRLLTEQQMLQHLDSRFRLLTSRRQDLPARHRSLHAALEWGCPTEPNLLRFFAALSVFRGGFTLAAAEAVGGVDALESLATLREQSLILVDLVETSPESGPSGMRYRMLETIREFADEKLSETAGNEVRRRSLAYYRHLAGELAPHLAEADSAAYFAALEAESANFRASIEFGLTDTPESLWMAYGLMQELRWFWGIRGHRMPLDAWRELACARRDQLPDLPQTWLTLDYATHGAPEAEQEQILQETLSRFEELGETLGAVCAHETLADLYRHRGDSTLMELTYRAVAERRRRAGDRRGYGYSLANLAGAFAEQGRVAEARVLWQECREISLGISDFGSVAVLDRAAAGALLGEDRIADALPLLQSAANTFRHKGESWQLMDTLNNLGSALLRAGKPGAARAALEEALDIARQRGDSDRANALLQLLALTEVETQ